MTTEASRDRDEEQIEWESERSGALFASVLSSTAGKQKTFTRGMIIHAVSKGLASPKIPTGAASGWNCHRVDEGRPGPRATVCYSPLLRKI